MLVIVLGTVGGKSNINICRDSSDNSDIGDCRNYGDSSDISCRSDSFDHGNSNENSDNGDC